MRHLPRFLPSASRLALAERCAHPWTSGTRWPRDVSSAEASIGNVVHAAGDATVRGEEADVAAQAHRAGLGATETRTAEALAEQVVSLLREEAAAGDVAWWAAEVPLALDLAAGAARVLPSRGHRDYSARRPGEMTGTADLVVVHASGRRVTVRDWKTGRQQGTEPAASNAQMAFLALAAARWLGADEVAVELAYVAPDGVALGRAELGPWELAEVEERVRALVVTLSSGPTPPSPGPWCVEAWCPLRGVCPATRGALAAVVREEALPVALTSPEAVARAWALLPRAEAALAGVRAAIDAYVAREPVDLGDGRRLVRVEQARRDLVVAEEAHVEALRAVLGEAAEEAVEVRRETSIAAIERAARRALAGKRGIGALRDRAVAALAEAGGVRVATWTATRAVGLKQDSE